MLNKRSQKLIESSLIHAASHGEGLEDVLRDIADWVEEGSFLHASVCKSSQDSAVRKLNEVARNLSSLLKD